MAEQLQESGGGKALERRYDQLRHKAVKPAAAPPRDPVQRTLPFTKAVAR
jgi:hypothetical protein